MVHLKRPESTGRAELYYNDEEAQKYARNTRIINIQTELAERAIELLHIEKEQGSDEKLLDEEEQGHETGNRDKKDIWILDIGSGSGLCSSVIESQGYNWVGMDISRPMVDIAKQRQEENELGFGDFLLSDMAAGIPFRPGTFDGAISISVLQWIFTVEKSEVSPKSRLKRLFTTLYACLRNGSRAVFQFYPENYIQINLILETSMNSGFKGGLVVDYPNSTKKKKYFLCLIVGAGYVPKGLSTDSAQEGIGISLPQQDLKARMMKRKGNIKDKEWVLRKKQHMRDKGYEDIPRDTKYTARKRGPKF